MHFYVPLEFCKRFIETLIEARTLIKSLLKLLNRLSIDQIISGRNMLTVNAYFESHVPFRMLCNRAAIVSVRNQLL